MRKLHVTASGEYDILIGSGLLGSVGELARSVTSAKKLMILSDDNVFPLYGEKLVSALSGDGRDVHFHIIPHGESSKNAENYLSLLEKLADLGFTRRDCIISLGGGVVGDLGGFAAATYMRGIGFIQVPTSLLAAVDASVGGKTAINLEHGKNLAGCFYQPKAVIIDTDCLHSLPVNEYSNGCAEVIKYGMISDKTLLDSILSVPVRDHYEDIIFRCIDIKRGFVEADERDTGSRMLLNFGHTLGHAFEKLSGYTLPHGFAVATGMAYVTRASVRQGLCGKDVLDSLLLALDRYQLPKYSSFGAHDIAAFALRDKKSDGDTVNLIVPSALGNCGILKVPTRELVTWVKSGEKDD